VGVEVHVQRGRDHVAAPVPDLGELVGQGPGVVVVDQHQHSRPPSRRPAPSTPLHHLRPQPLTARLPWGLSTSAEIRYLGDRVADDFGFHTARGYTLFNWNARYRYKALEAFLSIENLADTKWREAQFFFTSRLPGEPAGGVPDVHFTPGNPRTFLGGIGLHF